MAFGLVVLLSVFLFGLGVLVFSLPGRAEQTFGPPANHLSLPQRIWQSALLIWQAGDLTTPVDPLGEDRPFRVELGESTPSLIGRLWKEGLIGNPGAFRTYLTYTGLDTTLQAGNYTLNPGMTPIEIARLLQKATPNQAVLVVMPGWRLEEIAATLPTSGLNVKPDVFLAAARRIPPGYSFSELLPVNASLEGFMFPGTYEPERNLSADEVLGLLLNKFEEQVTPAIRQGFENQGLSLYQGIILASIVQKEAVIEDDMTFIASVFLNRLAIGMKLDSDPTVQYALGYDATNNNWWRNPLSLDDLTVNSPMNTYLNPGLPPQPIASPGLPAIKAVAFPAQTPYYYFRAGCDGSGRHIFAETYQEHLENACP